MNQIQKENTKLNKKHTEIHINKKQIKNMNTNQIFLDIKENFSLKNYNTFNIDVKSKYFIEINDIHKLQNLLKESKYKDVPKMIIGGGSNILLTKDFDGIVIKLSTKNISIIKENRNFVYLKIDAGENWDDLVKFCVKNKYYGIENLSYIPGSVGAAPIQNIGAYGVELKDFLVNLEAINIKTGILKTFSNKDCKFSYRNSIFKNEEKNQFIITSVTLRLNKTPKYNLNYGSIKEYLKTNNIKNPNIEQIRNAIIEIRKSKIPDPKETPNAGSFFKNPLITSEDYHDLKNIFPQIHGKKTNNKYKIAAAWLIEQAGWRAKNYNEVCTHLMQPLVIINPNKVSGQKILEYAKQVKLAVKAKFKIELEYEVNII